MRLRFFRAGKRVALYLPFDGESDTAALIAAAQVFVPAISHRRHARLRFYPLTGATAPGEFGISVPRLRLTPVSPQWLDLIVIPLVGVDAKGRRLGMGVATTIEPSRSVGDGAAGRVRTWSDSRLTAGARRRSLRTPGTYDWIHWRPNWEWSISYELLAVQIGT
jgi:hypothetical protein